jgi:subtilase family serine protease
MTNFSFKSLLKPFSIAVCSAVAIFATLPALAQMPGLQPRITSTIDNSSRTTLLGSRPQRANAAQDAGAVSPSLAFHGISLVFSRTPAQDADLDNLIAAQQNPASPLFHQWLTPAQFAARFGVADADIAATQSWLERQGFTVDGVSNSRNRIVFSGTASQVATAFGAPIHYFKSPAIGNQPATTNFAPSADLTIPSALASSVLAVRNLSSFRLHSQLATQAPRLKPQFTSAQSGSYFLTPKDVETIYDVNPAYNSGYNGAGQTIAVIGQSAVVLSDITNFQTALGVPTKAPGLFLVPSSGTSAISSGDEAESDLDLEYSSSLAPGATINFYYTGNNPSYGVFDALQWVVDYGYAPIITLSYGDCEFNIDQTNILAFDAILKQATTQGQTVIAASGDTGVGGCAEDTNLTLAEQQAPGVNYPASSVYVTGLGGTEFPLADITAPNTTYWTSATGTDVISSAKSYIPEQVWNDDAEIEAAILAGQVPSTTSPLSAGGGGISLYEARPTWQTGVPGIPTGTLRLVPDISLAASPNNPGFLYCSSDTNSTGITGSCTNGFRDANSTNLTLAGGTSFDAPIFAGLLAVINQAKGYQTGQGLINPTLYTIASNSSTYASAFHDITSGGNQCAAGATFCGTGPQTTEFVSNVGYDEASGLGSIDFNNLLTAWPSNSTVVATANSTTTLSAASASPLPSATDLITITVASATAAVTAVPTGSVTISINGTAAGSSIPLVSGVATYTFSDATGGSYIITATYSGDANYSASKGSVNVVVGSATFNLTAPNVSVTAGGSISNTAVLTPVLGYTGTVNFTLDVPNTLTNFCVSGNAATVTGTTAVSVPFTMYTNAATCNTMGLTIFTSSSTGGSRLIHFTYRHGVASITPPASPSPWKRLPLPAAFAGTLLLVCFRRRSKLLRAAMAVGVVLLLSFSGLGLTGCSNNSTTTSPGGNTSYSAAGTYTMTLTGADSVTPTITNSANFTLTVN